MTTPAVVVKHITKDHVRITPTEGWSVVLFNVGRPNVEAVVSADDGSETIRLRVEAAGTGRTMCVKIEADRGVDITYVDKEELP